MKNYNKFIYILLINTIILSEHCNSKQTRNNKNNSAQDGLEELSSTADTMDKELTKTGNSLGNLFTNIKSIFKKTSKDLDDDDNSYGLQSCKKQVNEINNKFNIIYEYANNKLKEILSNKNQKTVNDMYNSIAQLQSIWNAITNMQTADQVSRFLKSHNQFYASMNKYSNNNTHQSTSNNVQNQYSTKSNNNNNQNKYSTYYNSNTTYLNNNSYTKTLQKQIKQPSEIKTLNTNKNKKNTVWRKINLKNFL